MEHPFEVSYLRWIVLLPLLGAVVNGILGATLQKRFGKNAISLIACSVVGVAFLCAVAAFLHILRLGPEHRFLLDTLVAPWIHIGDLKVDIAFWVDPLSAVMILIVTGIGGLIHVYSIGYMHDDESYWRFFTFLNLFTAAMLTLVLGDNLLLLFVGWEGVGLCSYALIGFWYKEHANTTAGNKAFIVNRIGDAGFTLGIFTIFWGLNSAGHGTTPVFRELVPVAHYLQTVSVWGIPAATLAALFLFIGATGKSAQIPLYVWLPDAMAGPTPVSALIHAATMVTAGVYMMARMHFVFSLAPVAMNVVATVGALTAIFAATIGLAQNDIKRVLAYSTVSQLGYMVLGVGVGAYAAAIFHLLTHAFFKACLFLGSGSVIHAMGGEQDMRKMGGLREKMPYTFMTFFISTLAIAGLPPLSGFFSKDEILWKTFSGGHPFLWLLGFAGAGMTAFYMFRQVFMTFFGESRADHHTQHHLHESPPVMTYPLIILATGAVLAGFLGVPAALGGSNRFEQWLEPVLVGGHGHAAHVTEHAVESLEYLLMIASVGIAVAGILLAYQMYYRKTLSPEVFSSAGGGAFYDLVYNKYYIDEIYQATFVRGTLALCWLGANFDLYVIDYLVNGAARLTAFIAWLNGWFDNLVIDGLVNAIADGIFAIGNRLRQIQTGSINVYLYVIVGAVAAAQFLPRLSSEMLMPVLIAVVIALAVVGVLALLSARRPLWRPPILRGDAPEPH
ncbi:MAG: NADH-quinone oxidoreductase subunit L [Deltaproteobacteria bacterium]|nr:NADH-quinone oxidoreductase subunit L [Deltaproteobacteria bacterium]